MFDDRITEVPFIALSRLLGVFDRHPELKEFFGAELEALKDAHMSRCRWGEREQKSSAQDMKERLSKAIKEVWETD